MNADNCEKGVFFMAAGFFTNMFLGLGLVTVLAKYGALISISISLVVVSIGWVIWWVYGPSTPPHTCDDKMRSS